MAKESLALSGIVLGGLLGFFGAFRLQIVWFFLGSWLVPFLEQCGIHPLAAFFILPWVYSLIGAALLGLLGYQLGKYFYNDSDQVNQRIEETDVS
jgi:hypothetical protein